MSTKIYYAYEWSGNHVDLIKTLNEMKKAYVDDCVEFISRLFKFDSNKEHYENIKTLLELIKEESAQLEIGHPFDLNLSCVVYMHKGRTVAHFFGINEYKHPTVYKTIEKMKDFSYWNNTDGPEDVPEAEFENRGKWFDDLFNTYNSYIPSECGLTYDFYSDDIAWNIANKSYDKWKAAYDK